jgi:hypothetical protein
VEELQMDWLRSEDLKEEKNVTTPVVIIAGEAVVLAFAAIECFTPETYTESLWNFHQLAVTGRYRHRPDSIVHPAGGW